jgi:hypothetical protein
MYLLKQKQTMARIVREKRRKESVQFHRVARED